MGAVYAIFGLSLVGVVLLSTFVPLHLGERVADRVGVLVTIIATLTGAGLLSLAFTLDNLVASEISVGAFFQAPSTERAFMLVVLMFAAGTSGLLAALLLTIWDPQHNLGPTTRSGASQQGATTVECRRSGGIRSGCRVAVPYCRRADRLHPRRTRNPPPLAPALAAGDLRGQHMSYAGGY